MGLGIYEEGSGIAAALFCAERGARVLVTDLHPRSYFAHHLVRLRRYKNIRYVFGKHRTKDFLDADFIIKNPAVPKSSPYLVAARRAGVPIHNDWSVFLSLKHNIVVGVTGTRGKTTTATLINELLKTQYRTRLCGNIGVSPLAIFERVKKDDIVVAELSSWGLAQLPMVKKSPHIAVITNLLPDHLNKYKNINEYYRDKDNIFKYQTDGDYLVVNRDNATLRKRVKKAKSFVLWFSQKPFRGNGVYVRGEDVYFSWYGVTVHMCSFKNMRLPGMHNRYNALAAVCVAKIMGGISHRRIQTVTRSFRGVPHRLELVQTRRGVMYYDDTTSTTPDATIAALNALHSKHVILLAGGADKKLRYKKFVQTVKKYRARLVLFSGAATDKIIKEFKEIKYHRTLGMAKNISEALALAQRNVKKGDIILLSPGAASFGMFKNEFDRGAQFQKVVRRLN